MIPGQKQVISQLLRKSSLPEEAAGAGEAAEAEEEAEEVDLLNRQEM